MQGLPQCIIYARVSTDKQADKELSIPAQLQAMRVYAQQRSWSIAEEFIEPGASAKTADRPTLQRLLARIRDPGRKTDIVLVHKIDRLARSVYDHATIKALLTQRHIQLASVVENVDDSVPGQLVENIMASIAQFYSANLSEEVKKGMRQKVQGGGWPHKPPRGYVIVRLPGSCKIEPHRREAPILRLAFELYATGNYSVKALAGRLYKDGLTTRGGRPLAVSYLRRLLTNAFYIGRVRSGGLDVQGVHAPLVSDAVFKRVQETLEAKYRNPGVKGSVNGFPLRGVAICTACRGRMTAERHGRWNYYRCGRNAYKASSCRASFCNAARAHVDLARICQQVRITRTLADSLLAAADAAIRDRVTRASQRLQELESEESTLLEREMRLTAAFASGDISANAHSAHAGALRERRAAIEQERRGLRTDSAQLAASVGSVVEIGASMLDVYHSLSDHKRAEFVRTVFNTIVISREGIVGFTLHAPFDQLAIAATRPPQELTAVNQGELVAAILDAA